MKNLFNQDFSYYIKNHKLKINCIRFVRLRKEKKIVITIYYPYYSFVFTKNVYLKLQNTDFIFETDKDHFKDYHKIKNPYDWHIHFKINDSDIIKYIDFIFKFIFLNKEDVRNINDIIFQKINLNNLIRKKIVELKGNDDDEELYRFKSKLLKKELFNKIFKYDILSYALPLYHISFYTIRILNLKFKLNKNEMSEYKNIFNFISDKYKSVPNNINLEKINLQYTMTKMLYNESLDKKFFNKRTDNLYVNLLLHLLDYKKIQIQSVLNVNPYDNEWKLKLLNSLINKTEYFNTNNINFEILVYFSILNFILNVIMYNIKTPFEDYVNRRLCFHLSWGLIQYYKYNCCVIDETELKNKFLSFIKILTDKNENEVISLEDCLEIFKKKFIFENDLEYDAKPFEFEKIKLTNRLSPFN